MSKGGVDRDHMIRKLRPALKRMTPGLTDAQATEILVTCSPAQRFALWQISRACMLLKNRKREKAVDTIANRLRPRENPVISSTVTMGLSDSAWSQPR